MLTRSKDASHKASKMNQQAIVFLFEQAIQCSPDVNTLMFWTQVLATGEKTMDDLTLVLKSMPEFKDRLLTRYETVWKKLYGCNNPVDHFEDFFILACHKKIGLTNDEIISMIEEMSKVCQSERVELNEFHSVDLSQVEETKFIKLVTKKETEMEMESLFSYDEDFVNRFEDAFKRPIFIQEYVRLFLSRETIDFQDTFVKHTISFDAMQVLYRVFLNEVISEHAFVCKFLGNQATIFEFEKRIVSEPRYIELMKLRIDTKYQSVYDEKLELVDIDYIFGKVQTRRIQLQDEISLDEVLLSYKGESDEIVRHMTDVYGRVLDRLMERSELLDSAYKYRKGAYDGRAFDDVTIEIECELMSRLEFHDKIKRQIRFFDKTVNVTRMFKLLEWTIKENDLTKTRLEILWVHLESNMKQAV